MFTGEYNHTIDAKGRLIVPSKFREQLGEEFVVTKGLDGCLFVYSTEEWNRFEEKFSEVPLTTKDARKSRDSSLPVQPLAKWTSREEFYFRQT